MKTTNLHIFYFFPNVLRVNDKNIKFATFAVYENKIEIKLVLK